MSLLNNDNGISKLYIVFIFPLITISFFCTDKRSIANLEFQYSPDSTTIIYKYRYSNSMGFGYKVAKVGSKFSRELPELRGLFITKWVNNSEINVQDIDNSKESLKSSTKQSVVNGIKVTKETFHVQNFQSCEYNFADISQSQDSISFESAEMIYGNPIFEKTTFRKGPITIESIRDTITKIQIRTIVTEGTRMTLLDYYFIPKSPLTINNIVSYGIFKSIK